MAALILTAVVVNQSSIHWRTNIDDDHLFGYYGWCISQGARPYLDVWDNKPPGIWWANALMFRLVGQQPIAASLAIGTLSAIVALVAFVTLARTLYHRSVMLPAALLGCVLLTDQRFECGANRTETIVLALEPLAVFGYLRWLQRGSTGWLAAGALAAGAAPLFKQSGFAAGVACAVHLVVLAGRFRSAGATGIGPADASVPPRVSAHCFTRGGLVRALCVAGGFFLVGPLTAAAILWKSDALRDFGFAVVTFNHAYFAVDDASWLPLRQCRSAYAPYAMSLLGILIAAGAGGAWNILSRVRRTAQQERASVEAMSRPLGTGVLWLWFLFSAYLACVGPGRQGHHLMPVLAPLGLLALAPLDHLAGARGLPAAVVGRPAIALLLVLYAWIVAAMAIDSLSLARLSWAAKPEWCALEYSRRPDWLARGEAIQRVTKAADKIYVWGWTPGTYTYAFRQPASRFATLEKAGQVGPHARFIVDGAIADIRRERPRLLVISVAEYEAMVSTPGDEFGQWVKRMYHPIETLGGMHLLGSR